MSRNYFAFPHSYIWTNTFLLQPCIAIRHSPPRTTGKTCPNVWTSISQKEVNIPDSLFLATPCALETYLGVGTSSDKLDTRQWARLMLRQGGLQGGECSRESGQFKHINFHMCGSAFSLIVFQYTAELLCPRGS